VKHKLLIILGSGSSIPLGMPSVTHLDEEMSEWSREWAAEQPQYGGNNYFELLRQSIKDYYVSRVHTPCPPVNFEKVLGEMLALSHWMTPSPWGDTLRQTVCGNGAPSRLLPNAEDHGNAIALRTQLGYLTARLAAHIRACSLQLDTRSEPFVEYTKLFEALRQSFDVGVFNLNYDTAARVATPEAYTGFGKDGRFEPDIIHSRAQWDYLYHLHGSVHHSLIQPNIDEIRWRDDLSRQFCDDDGGTGPKLRSAGRLFPKTSLLAGGFKLDQLLVEPFHSFQAALVRHVYAADAILIGGYGFGDAHVNWALHNRLLSRVTRPPVMILDNRSVRAASVTDDYWITAISTTLATDGSFFREADCNAIVGASDSQQRGSFEIAQEHRIALWDGGFTNAAQRINEIIAWLEHADKSLFAGL
jgi:hypothetical protein